MLFLGPSFWAAEVSVRGGEFPAHGDVDDDVDGCVGLVQDLVDALQEDVEVVL